MLALGWMMNQTQRQFSLYLQSASSGSIQLNGSNSCAHKHSYTQDDKLGMRSHNKLKELRSKQEVADLRTDHFVLECYRKIFLYTVKINADRQEIRTGQRD